MKKDFISWIGTACGTICTAVQTNQIFQYVSLGITILSTLVSLVYTIWRWYRKAKADGKITEDEIDEIVDDVNNIINDKEKGEDKDD